MAAVEQSFQEPERGMIIKVVDQLDISLERLGNLVIKSFERLPQAFFP
jgi:hypothetical protein